MIFIERAKEAGKAEGKATNIHPDIIRANFVAITFLLIPAIHTQ
jgi:hypothetical protein